ncbi:MULTISPECIES: hypothetical protein [environmental samples]|jgi:uncharacterized membrane protein YcfT|uniref:hypothetical protein n=1 Tax=environmental samples TaxID=876090 RepID=UPI00033EB453|nr:MULTISPECIES: hypothetical protein [environmental samples]CDC71992.1 putative uncharacterized protein [Oscillibacter sp. CAG:155]
MKQTHFQQLILKTVRLLELLLAAVIVLFIIFGALYLLGTTVPSLLADPGSFSISTFLSHALLLVMGLEFVKMLALHTAGAVIDVLLFTIVRQMIVSHAGSLETLLGVVAVAVIFAVRKFLHPDQYDGENTGSL